MRGKGDRIRRVRTLSWNQSLEQRPGRDHWWLDSENWLSAWGQYEPRSCVTGGCENPGLDFPICKMGAELWVARLHAIGGCYCYYRYRDYNLEGTGAGFTCCRSDKFALQVSQELLFLFY